MAMWAHFPKQAKKITIWPGVTSLQFTEMGKKFMEEGKYTDLNAAFQSLLHLTGDHFKFARMTHLMAPFLGLLHDIVLVETQR